MIGEIIYNDEDVKMLEQVLDVIEETVEDNGKLWNKLKEFIESMKQV
jgi:hypothetical protein